MDIKFYQQEIQRFQGMIDYHQQCINEIDALLNKLKENLNDLENPNIND